MSSRIRPALVLLLLIAPPVAGAQAPSTDDEKAAYALGVLQAARLKDLLFTPAEMKLFRQGVGDGFEGKPQIDPEQEMNNLRRFSDTRAKRASEAETRASEAFLVEAAARPGWKTTDSGLIYKILRDGIGDSPTIVDRVSVHYHGTLRDGTVFDSSVERGKPLTLALNRVSPCWTEALQLLQVGGKVEIVCPAEIAYGNRGSGRRIKPGAALSFDVELISIER